MKKILLIIAVLFAIPSQAFGVDVFDRHTSYWVKDAFRNSEPVDSLSSGMAAGWDTLGPTITSPCLILKTNNGNWTKALISWGLKKDDEGNRIPVFVIERYVTFDNERQDLSIAHGKNVILFPGSLFNFDIGQIVPENNGGDIQFNDKKRIAPVAKAAMHGISGSRLPTEDKNKKYDPTAHDGVQPRDFSGSWMINGDGRWIGKLILTVDEDGKAFGQYISDETKSVYPVEGRVTGEPHRIDLKITLANTAQTIEGYLWTKDKSAMAGITTIVERKFGFYALREKEKKE